MLPIICSVAANPRTLLNAVSAYALIFMSCLSFNVWFVVVNMGGLVLGALLENWPPTIKEDVTGAYNVILF